MGIVQCCEERRKEEQKQGEHQSQKYEVKDEGKLIKELEKKEQEVQGLRHLGQEQINQMSKEQRLDLADSYGVKCKRGEMQFIQDYMALIVFNGSGKMNYQEYSDYVHHVFRKLKRVCNEQDIKERFKQMNPDNEGFVNQKGLEQFMIQKAKETKK